MQILFSASTNDFILFIGAAAHPSLQCARAEIAEGENNYQELLKSQVGQ